MLNGCVCIVRKSTRAIASLALLALPLAAHAAVEIGPGDTASDLVADGGGILDECATTATETCTVSINAAGNEVGALVDAGADGAGAASGEIFTDFSISVDEEAPLIGSFLSGQVDVNGLLRALAADAMASVDVSLHVRDMTAGVLVGAHTVVSDSVVNGSLPVSHSSAVVIPLPLTRGHDYRISLIIAAEALGSVDEGIGAMSDFVSTASWSDLSLTAGQDPFEPIAEIADRVSDLESDVDDLESAVSRLAAAIRDLAADLDELEALVDRIANALRDLQQTVAELREDFESHTHTYLTGRGTGHNNTQATTTRPSDGDLTPEPRDTGNGQSGSPEASSPPSEPEPSNKGRRNRTGWGRRK
jgi:outer membrane murein-binding lipoprotein Lpp